MSFCFNVSTIYHVSQPFYLSSTTFTQMTHSTKSQNSLQGTGIWKWSSNLQHPPSTPPWPLERTSAPHPWYWPQRTEKKGYYLTIPSADPPKTNPHTPKWIEHCGKVESIVHMCICVKKPCTDNRQFTVVFRTTSPPWLLGRCSYVELVLVAMLPGAWGPQCLGFSGAINEHGGA
jgi:hypothetical protein